MNKAVKIAVGIIVVVGAVATGGAWYTGTQLQGVIDNALAQANQELQMRLAGQNGSAKVELVSLDRHLFSSTAHYRLQLQGPRFSDNGQPVDFMFTDQLEHGPLPISRLKVLNLAPVMAVSNYTLDRTPVSEKWYTLTQGQAPLVGRVVLGYDQASQGTLVLQPIDFTAQGGGFKFSGLTLNVSATAQAQKYELTGNMGSLAMDWVANQVPMHVVVTGLDINSGGTKGRSGFYLGHGDARVGEALIQAGDKPALAFKDFTSTSLLQEVEGNLAAQIAYQVGMIRYGNSDVGASQMSWKLSNFDIAASQALSQLYQTKVLPQVEASQQARAAGQPFKLQLSPADQQLFTTQVATLLSGKPHIELENLSLKTAHGESRVSLLLDLANPGPFNQPPADLYKKTIGQLDVKVQVSKPSISDLVKVQANQPGVGADPALVDKQAKDFSETAGGMAAMFQVAKVVGDNIVSTLHYANNEVDFNGVKMPPEQFLAMVLSKFGGMAPARGQ